MAIGASAKKIGGLVADDIRTTGSRVREQAKQTLARKIHRAILEKGWTPAELARRANLSRDNISTYMRASSLPSGESLAKLAKALGMESDDLLPNRPDATYSDPDSPTLEITATPSNPGKAWLRVNQLISMSTATKIAELLQNESSNDDAKPADGKRGR